MELPNKDNYQTPFYQAKGENLQLIVTIFENGFFISLSSLGAPKLGTVALCLPIDPTIGISRERKFSGTSLDRRGITTTTVIGSRNEIFAKALAEKAVMKTKKIVYLSVNYDDNNNELFTESLQLLEEFLQTVQL
ncbi:MAG TPA: proteasome assembly chaperone 4 family protein [candidate division Zixibacteria bacterium]|nr:proteasome assembly chaperone 4 family protein [candidate division Zixibacteria bacterium]